MLLHNNWLGHYTEIREEDKLSVMKTIDENQLSIVSGGLMARFEKRFAKFSGTKYGVAFNSGTSSILAALWAVGVRKGDEVIVSNYGFEGTIAPILTLGASIVPCDINTDTFTIDPQSIKKNITSKTKAIFVHNPWGVPADYNAIKEVTSLPIVADAAHAHGAMYQEEPLAKAVTIACYSLGLNKLITGGELGCAVTNDIELRDAMITYGHINRAPMDLKKSDWNGNAIGLKLRPHPFAMALAMPQIKRYEEKKELLVATCQSIEEVFKNYGFIPQQAFPNSTRVYWRIILKIDEQVYKNVPTDTIEAYLKEHGIPVEKNHYWPLLSERSIFEWEDYKESLVHTDTPIATATVPRTITLPAPVILPDEELHRINEVLSGIQKLTEGLTV